MARQQAVEPSTNFYVLEIESGLPPTHRVHQGPRVILIVLFFILSAKGASLPKTNCHVSRSMHSALNSVLGMAVASLR